MFEHLSVAQTRQLIEQQNPLLVDIRDRQSYSQGHIEGAQHIDNDSLPDFLASADKNRPVIVCCYHGNSSQPAAEWFNQQGFSRSYSMDGGMKEWALANPLVPSVD